jgi:hypothetical protein
MRKIDNFALCHRLRIAEQHNFLSPSTPLTLENLTNCPEKFDPVIFFLPDSLTMQFCLPDTVRQQRNYWSSVPFKYAENISRKIIEVVATHRHSR